MPRAERESNLSVSGLENTPETKTKSRETIKTKTPQNSPTQRSLTHQHRHQHTPTQNTQHSHLHTDILYLQLVWGLTSASALFTPHYRTGNKEFLTPNSWCFRIIHFSSVVSLLKDTKFTWSGVLEQGDHLWLHCAPLQPFNTAPAASASVRLGFGTGSGKDGILVWY